MYVQLELHLSIKHKRYGWRTRWLPVRVSVLTLAATSVILVILSISSSCDLHMGLVRHHRSALPHVVHIFDTYPMHIVPQPPNISIMRSRPKHWHIAHGGNVGLSWHNIHWGGVNHRHNEWRQPCWRRKSPTALHE